MHIGTANDVDECRFDLSLVDIERADPMPAGGVGTKIIGRMRSALTLDRRQSLQVERQRRVSFVAFRREPTCESTGGASLAQPVERPAALPKALEHPGLA